MSVCGERGSTQVRRLPLHISLVKERLRDPSVSPVARFAYGSLCDAAARGETGWFCERDLCRICLNPPGTLHQLLRELAAKGLVARKRDRATRRIMYELPLLPRSARGRYDRFYFMLYSVEDLGKPMAAQ